MSSNIKPQPVYGSADIASTLGVSRATFSNWLNRYTDTPTPSYITTHGVAYYSLADTLRWKGWHREHMKSRAVQAKIK